MKMKKIIALGLTVVSLFAFSGTAFAAAGSSDTWSVNYTKGAPTTTANPVDYLYVKYYSGGYKAKAYTLTGSGDRKVTISSSSAGSMSSKEVTTTGSYVYWSMKGSTSGDVTFKVVASGSTSCSSTGIIQINS